MNVPDNEVEYFAFAFLSVFLIFGGVGVLAVIYCIWQVIDYIIGKKDAERKEDNGDNTVL